MKCPNCNSETSEMLTRCEWCGGGLPHAHAQATAQGPGNTAPPPQGYQSESSPYGGPPAGFPPPSDASYSGYGQGGWGAQREPVQPVGQPWYMKPSTYVVALVLVVVIIGAIAVSMAVKGSGPRYANLVVGGQPTVLDFYTDT